MTDQKARKFTPPRRFANKVTIRVSDEMKAALRELADRQETSPGQLARVAIKNFLKEETR